MSQRTNCTILLIDDEQAGLQLRKLVLENTGYQVFSATSPDEAMSLFRLHDVDVVVTDHLLGRATAAALAASMKRLKPHVPIVSLSGTTNIDEALRYADHFIGKAEGPDTLIATLDRVLAQSAGKRKPVPVGQSPALGDLSTVQALLAAIIEDSTDAILSKTLDGIVTSWNHAAEIMYGYTREEMVGKPVDDAASGGPARRGCAHLEQAQTRRTHLPLRDNSTLQEWTQAAGCADDLAYPQWAG